MSVGFYGCGCPHSGFKALLAQTNKMLMHYEAQSSDRKIMRVSIEAMIIELGLGFQPFMLSFKEHIYPLTHSWLKTIWEK